MKETNSLPTITLVDATTGERLITVPAAITEHAKKEEKGWILRRRTAYMRRTGNKIRVEYSN